MKPLALDLCCGKGGWTIGLQAAGWEVIGFDVKAWDGYPGELVIGDVRQIDGTKYKQASLVCASPPCQEFSYRDLPFGKTKSLPPPDKSIWEACIRIAAAAEAPLILENVRGAQKWMGTAKWRHGAYYLWGDLPALMPLMAHPPRKNFPRKIYKGKSYGQRPDPGDYPSVVGSSKSNKRKEWSAKIAMIPFELAHWIGECFYPKETP